MQSGKIPDSAITGSSVYNSRHQPYSGRLNRAGSFCSLGPSRAGKDGSWLQIDLGEITTVTAWQHKDHVLAKRGQSLTLFHTAMMQKIGRIIKNRG